MKILVQIATSTLNLDAVRGSVYSLAVMKLLCLLLFAVSATLCLGDDAKINLDDPATFKRILSAAVDGENLQKRDKESDELYYVPNSQTPYTGWIKYMYSNGQVGCLLQFKHGKPHGLVTNWHDNGQKAKKGNYVDGEPLGLITEWHSNGQKKQEGNFVGGKIHGLVTLWDKDGNVTRKERFENGEMVEKIMCLGDDIVVKTEWYENQRMKRETHYVDGKKHGIETFWYDNGQKEAESNYVDGKMHGITTMWHDNGQKSSESNYKDGKRHGLETGWRKDGSVINITMWKNDSVEEIIE